MPPLKRWRRNWMTLGTESCEVPYRHQDPEPRNPKLVTLNPKHAPTLPAMGSDQGTTRTYSSPWSGKHYTRPGNHIHNMKLVVSLTKHQALSCTSCSWQHEWTSKLHRWWNVYNLCSSLLSITCTWLPVKRFMIKHTACNHAIIYPHDINKDCLYTTRYRPVLTGNQLAQQVWSLHETQCGQGF
jgi:hypothetical protein